MKILFLSPRFYPDIGGVETHVFETAEKLIKRRHEVKIITEGRTKSLETISEMKIIRCNFGENGWTKKFRIWKKLWSLRREIEWADIIHCHDVFFWYLPFRFMYPLKFVVTTFHGYETIFPPQKKAIRIRQLSKKLSMRTVNVGSYIEKWYGTPADAIVYGGVDDVKTIVSRDRNSKVEIVLIGRLEEDIGVNIYLEVLALLKRKNINVEFKACGDGKLKDKVKNYGIVHGFVPDTLPFIEKADIIFASSYLSILQALSLGKKVIAVYTNPLKENYLKDSPFAQWITITDSATHIAAYIRNMNNLPKENPYKLKKFLEDMSWDHIADIYEKLYKQSKPSR